MSSSISISTYSAPNTPIASAKRSRRSIHSPTISKEPSERPTIQSPIRSIRPANDDTNNLSSSFRAPDTPSKILFSPSLRTADGKQIEVLPRPQLPSRSEDGVEEDPEEFNPYLFMAFLPSHVTTQISGKICLPPKDPSLSPLPTLVLDLDETLVHCTVEPIPNADIEFSVNFNNTFYQVYVRKRPHLDYFLDEVSKSFEVVLFTASQQVYANKLLDLLDPENKFIHHRLFRESCLFVQGNFLKDLSVLGRDLQRTIIIDNSPHAYGYQTANGVPIESWFDDDSDEELLKAIAFLSAIHDATDVRPIIEDHFRTHELIETSRQLFNNTRCNL